MKRLLTVLCAVLFSFSIALAAQSTSAQSDDNSAKQDKKIDKAEKKEAKAAEKGKDMKLTGWVKEESGKTVFVNDKDKKSWDIANPDAVKGHEGHHVKVSAKLDEANHSVTIDKLTMMRASKQSGGKH
ncbi:MAG TPA: hypothetical protein VN679_00945 [Candidatus Acidoferrales bacterium]|jgi:hypothetical protein|nr:hypothetical protein [Candidatus Acidoferrales bacterium]